MNAAVKRSLAAVAAAILMTTGAPSPAAARVRVSVQVAFGTVAVGGVGAFVALSDSWVTPAGEGRVPDALIEMGGTRVRFGMPLVPLDTTTDEDSGDQPVAGGLLLNLMRWRF